MQGLIERMDKPHSSTPYRIRFLDLLCTHPNAQAIQLTNNPHLNDKTEFTYGLRHTKKSPHIAQKLIQKR